MRLRTVFLVCFAVSCLPALIWSAQSAMHAQSVWSNARQAVLAAVAMGDALRLEEAFSIEHGALQERALSDGPGLEDLSKIAAVNDALLDQTQASLRNAGLPEEAVARGRSILASARHRVGEAVRLPRAQRDVVLIPSLMVQLYTRLDEC